MYIYTVYAYGHDIGQTIMILITEVPKVIIQYGNTRGATFQDKVNLCRRFIFALLKGGRLPSECFDTAVSSINKKTNDTFSNNNSNFNRNSRFNNFKKFQTKNNYQEKSNNQQQNNNQKFKPHFCKGPDCTVKNCQFKN